METFDVGTYIEGHFDKFMRHLVRLPKRDRDALLGYYVLGKPQWQIGLILGESQTRVSTLIRRAVHALIMDMLLGRPTEQTLSKVFVEANIENLLSVPLSRIVTIYAQALKRGSGYRAASVVADATGIYYRLIQTVIAEAARVLAESRDVRHMVVSSWLAGMPRKPQPKGRVELRVTDPHFDQIFVGRASIGQFSAPRIM